jgi:hypothetical protein
MPYTVDAIQRILCITFLHSPNNIFQQQVFCFFPESHRFCESVLPLDSASKDVKNSSLLSDTLEEQEYMTETLQKMEENRDENRKLLKQKKSLIIKQMRAAKSKVLKLIVICFRKVKNS